jgi:predicted transcriptional regulator
LKAQKDIHHNYPNLLRIVVDSVGKHYSKSMSIDQVAKTSRDEYMTVKYIYSYLLDKHTPLSYQEISSEIWISKSRSNVYRSIQIVREAKYVEAKKYNDILSHCEPSFIIELRDHYPDIFIPEQSNRMALEDKILKDLIQDAINSHIEEVSSIPIDGWIKTRIVNSIVTKTKSILT